MGEKRLNVQQKLRNLNYVRNSLQSNWLVTIIHNVRVFFSQDNQNNGTDLRHKQIRFKTQADKMSEKIAKQRQVSKTSFSSDKISKGI